MLCLRRGGPPLPSNRTCEQSILKALRTSRQTRSGQRHRTNGLQMNFHLSFSMRGLKFDTLRILDAFVQVSQCRVTRNLVCSQDFRHASELFSRL